MSDIVPIRRRPEARSEVVDGAGALTRINRYEDLRAGQYWRAKQDIPELTKPERRERNVYLPEDHPDYRKGAWGDNVIGQEKYYVDVPVRPGCPEGLMLLVRSLKLVDGEVHAVVLEGHPSEEGKSRTYLLDEFFHSFEAVGEDEAKAIREREIAALQAEIGELQKAMLAGPPAETPVALLGHQAKLPPKPSVGTMIANIGHVEALQATAERAVAIAEAQSKWITTHSQEIGRKTSALVPFFKEKASAALASTESVMRYATELTKGVQSLGLYVGTDVEMNRLIEGESAPQGEQLVIYRDMLYMDEEYLVNLASGEGRENGADHEDFDDFVQALKTDPALMARIFPYPRMVVLMRYRRTERVYVRGHNLETALANDEYNKPNRKQFLLIRDGDNVTQVWSALTTQEISALYPTKADGDAFFRGADGTAVTMEDLDLSGVKGRFTDYVRIYRNLLLLLWGLNDREGVFGPFYDPADWSSDGFLNEGFQHRYFKFWDPMGESRMLGTGRPPFRQWLEAANGWLRSGSRVLVMKSAVAIAGNTIEKHQPAVVRELEDAFEFVARKTKKGHVVAVDAGRMVYPRARYKNAYYLKQTYDVVLDESNHGYSEHGGIRWLCLDMIEAADIDHYLESRYDRPAYMQFYGLLLMVRAQLREEDRQIAPVIAKLEAAYAESGTPVPAGTTVRDVARHAIRLWRTAGRGRMVPSEGAEGHAEAYKGLLTAMWTLAGNNHPIAEAEALAADQGRVPLRLCLTGRDRYCLYATSVGDEIEERLFGHVWVTRLSCVRKGGRLVPSSARVMLLPDAVTDEETLHEWEAAADWKGRTIPASVNTRAYYESDRADYDYDLIRKGFALAMEGSLSGFIEPPEDLDAAIAHLVATRKKLTGKREQVRGVTLVQPFAVLRKTAFVSHRVEGFSSRREYETAPGGFLVLSLQDEGFRALHRTLEDPADREKVAQAYASIYRSRTGQYNDFVRGATNQPTFQTTHLVDWAKTSADPYQRGSSWGGDKLEANWAETLRRYDVQEDHTRHGDGREIWSPRLDEMAVWMDPTAPDILNRLCAKHGWEAVPFVPKLR